MTDRKKEVVRLLIYCVLSFVPFWVIVPVMSSRYGEPVYMSEAAASAVYALGTFGMMIPSAAHLLTRLLTKEGFRNTYLCMNVKGNVKWYLASVWVKLLEAVIAALLMWRLCAKELRFGEAFLLDAPKALIGMFLLQIAFSLVVCFPAFGEEWGWRGYMMPKLLKLMPMPAAIVVGGIIWGLWHAPLTIAGHNFGVDYWGYPWWGIAQMCLMCVLMNAFLTLITEKTKSVYPASFAHMINNNLGASLVIMLAGSEALGKAVDAAPSTFWSVFIPLQLITAVASFWILMRKK